MHDLIAKLTEMLNLTPEQQFRVTATIKRHIHEEKASVFHRYFLYSQGAPIFDRTDPENPKVIGHEAPKDEWINSMFKAKWEQHALWAGLPDEEVVTWSVGTHKFVQLKPPCSVCNKDLNEPGVGYTRVYAAGKSTIYCVEHAPKDET